MLLFQFSSLSKRVLSRYIFVLCPLIIIFWIMYNFATKKSYEFYESDKTKALKFTVVSHLNQETYETSYFSHWIHLSSSSWLRVLGRLKENNDFTLRTNKSILPFSWADYFSTNQTLDFGWTLGSYPVLI